MRKFSLFARLVMSSFVFACGGESSAEHKVTPGAIIEVEMRLDRIEKLNAKMDSTLNRLKNQSAKND